MDAHDAGISLGPDAPPEAVTAVLLALEALAADAARRDGAAGVDMWRCAALAEAVEREPNETSPGYASPRRSRGATRA